MLLRALLAFITLPGLVAFAGPLLIAWPRVREGTFNALALILLIPGVTLLLWCLRDFFVTGKGTLAPWDPPRTLVSVGPYRFSRNPMYVGVSLMLWGWAIAFSSAALVLYALLMMVVFHVRVLLNEEPYLARTHGRRWDDYRARVPRWIFPSRRAVWLSWAAVIVLLALAGLTYEAYADAEAAREFPPPGMMVDIGGRRLHLLCIGREDPLEPTIIFEASGWSNALSFAKARERLATRTKVCSYDRLGRGWSDPAPSVTTIAGTASALGVLQDRAKLVGPFVIVASSIGGLTAEMFARTYPERVAGIVFVDAGNSLLVDRLASYSLPITALACTAGTLSRFGVIRLLDPFDIGSETGEARRSAAITYSAGPWTATCAMARGLTAIRREFQQAPPLSPDIRVAVLSASSKEEIMPPFAERFIDANEIRRESEAAHRAFAERTHGTWKKIPNSTHLIAGSQPDAVADAVFDMLDAIRKR